MLGLILLVILVLLLVGALPHWGYARSYGYGYYPSALIFVLIIVVIVLLFTGVIPHGTMW